MVAGKPRVLATLWMLLSSCRGLTNCCCKTFPIYIEALEVVFMDEHLWVSASSSASALQKWLLL